MDQIVTIQSYRYGPDGIEQAEIPVVAEYHVSFLLNGRPFLVVACSGSDIAEMAAGHLLAEGIVKSRADIKRIDVDEDSRTVDIITAQGPDMFGRLVRVRTLVSGCAGGGGAGCLPRRDELPRVRPEAVTSAMKDFLGLSDTYRRTHGVHSAALYDLDGSLMAFYDELGRHNAVDKLIGTALLKGLSLERAMLFTTGRVASEILAKAAVAGVPVLVSRAAPTSMAVAMAREANLMLLTGVTAKGFYIHHGRECLAVDS